MKVTDYIVEFLIEKQIKHVFGYPGGVICHFIDSLSKYPEIEGHINYHEQASAFAACGYAQESGLPGVAYTTSGPGATNLVTGIANAFYDSTPAVFFTGQVDTYGLKRNLGIRQRGFQETDIVGIVKPITKYAVRIDDPNRIRYELEKAFYEATSGNPGPVLVDLPADVQRAEIDEEQLEVFEVDRKSLEITECIDSIVENLKSAKRPCLILGNGIKQSGMKDIIKEIVNSLDIPIVFSMPAIDILPSSHRDNFGFVGANGHRSANFVLGKSDLIVTIGTRLDLKQVGNNREKFAQQARILRLDIDTNNLEYKVHNDEIQFNVDIKDVLPKLAKFLIEEDINFSEWRGICEKIKEKVSGFDDMPYTALIKAFSDVIPDDVRVTADVGQSEVWTAQQFRFKPEHSFHISGGHGSMGYSLPAAIGTYYASARPVLSFNGDGGIQMNIQELQFLVRENIPVTVVVLNNHSLGMIRGFQEANFSKNYQQTTVGTGYSCPDFKKIADAYGLAYTCIRNIDEIKNYQMSTISPNFVEIIIPDETILQPNFGQSGFIQDQRPYMDRELYEGIMDL